MNILYRCMHVMEWIYLWNENEIWARFYPSSIVWCVWKSYHVAIVVLKVTARYFEERKNWRFLIFIFHCRWSIKILTYCISSPRWEGNDENPKLLFFLYYFFFLSEDFFFFDWMCRYLYLLVPSPSFLHVVSLFM
jgi:hypothetical protein